MKGRIAWVPAADRRAIPGVAAQDPSLAERREDMMALGLMWNYPVVELSWVPEQDEAMLDPYGLIGYELVV